MVRMKLSIWLVIALALPASSIGVASSGRVPHFSPQAIRQERAKLYVAAAQQPLAKLAPKIERLATESERCRLTSGSKACGLLATPLKSSDLKEIFKYYVKQPSEAALDQQKLGVSKSNWSWKAAPAQH